MSSTVAENLFEIRIRKLISQIRAQDAFLSTAESLTGGMLSSVFVAVPNISEIFRGGIVAYSNEIKAHLLGVEPQVLAAGGAVQGIVAEQMALGAARIFRSQYALSTTGVAGPGAAEGKVQGTVFIGITSPTGTKSKEYHFSGDRQQVRQETVSAAISLLYNEIFPEN